MRLRGTAKVLAKLLPPPWKPSMVIGEAENPYLRRWYLLPRNYWFNVMVHEYLRSDEDRANHDHPWWNFTFVVKGAFMEWIGKYSEGGAEARLQGDTVYRSAEAAHRIELFPGVHPVRPVTLFVTGRKVREWGFWCPKGWKSNREYLNINDDDHHSTVGKGCD